ncbi:MAG: ATP-binding cassette domain-containing protein [Bacilli bacterium]
MNICLDRIVVQLADAPERRLLDDISCTFHEKGITLLVGRTGAGKSTLMDVLAGLRAPDAGFVWLETNGRTDRRRATARDLNLLCSVMFQSPEEQLFAPTVRDELAYNLRPFRLPALQQRGRMTAGLESAGLTVDWLDRSPLTLSHGQKRSVALACAFAPGTPWLFLDEPTAGLDPGARADTARSLLNWREQTSGGAVIATHDLSTFLPLADQIVILHDGRLHAVMRPEDLSHAPDALEQAGVGLPEEVSIAQFLRGRGIAVGVGEAPEKWAAAIFAKQGFATGVSSAGAVGQTVPAAAARQPVAPAGAAGQQVAPADAPPHASAMQSVLPTSAVDATDPIADGRRQADPIADGLRRPAPLPHRRRAPESHESPAPPRTETGDSPTLRSLDARAKWLVYMLVSAGTLVQTAWPGTLAAAVPAAILAGATRAPWRSLWRPMRPLLIFGALAGAFAGLRINTGHPRDLLLSFAWEHALASGRQLFAVLIVLLYGRVLTLTTTGAELRRGLERAAARLRFAHTMVEAAALTVSLLLRMLPLVSREWMRFSRIVRARGKSAAKPGRIAPRDAPALLIPLLLALLQRAEDLTLAMESRGYRQLGQRRLALTAHPLNRRDWFAVGVGSALFIMLILVRRV